MGNKARQKGTGAETSVNTYLNEEGIRARRNPLQGALDKGDIELLDLPGIVEVKNQKRLELSVYLDETAKERDNAKAIFGVAWHKRPRKGHPKDWYVTMSGEDFVKVLKMLQDKLE